MGAFAFLVMNEVGVDSGLYVPVSDFGAWERVEPRRDLDVKSFSSYHSRDFVASLVDCIPLRSAVYIVEVRSALFLVAVVAELAVIVPVFFLRRLNLWPDSSSEEE